jgi:hypothetical protein
MTCTHCHDTGYCDACDGTGTTTSGPIRPCEDCGGAGVCPYCDEAF